MAGWWTRNPFYLWYMLREASCVFITVYALVLLNGVLSLYRGRAAYEAWVAGLSMPWSIGFHALAVLLVLYHTWTWFKIMPRTMPFLRVAGRRVPDALIVAAGLAFSVITSLFLLGAAWWLSPWTPR